MVHLLLRHTRARMRPFRKQRVMDDLALRNEWDNGASPHCLHYTRKITVHCTIYLRWYCYYCNGCLMVFIFRDNKCSRFSYRLIWHQTHLLILDIAIYKEWIIICWIAIFTTEIMSLELSRPVNNETVIIWFSCVICCIENDSIAGGVFISCPFGWREGGHYW